MSLHGELAGATKRRRGRRLRAWHRHVRTTVAMELATALHHSAQRVEAPREGVEHEKHVGLRAQKPPLPGTRPGVLLDPEPQVRAATVGYVATGAPSLSVVLVPDMMHDDGTVQYLLQQSLLARQAELDRRKRRVEEEEKKAKEKEEERKQKVLDSLEQKLQQMLHESSSSAVQKRKRKKRRKRRTPRTSSRSSCGRAFRRQRQWHVPGSPGDFLLRAVFPSIVVRREMPCIMAGMDLKDRCSGMY